MAADPSGRIVLITGCASGIGKATAERLREDGWTVVATALDPSTLAGLEEEAEWEWRSHLLADRGRRPGAPSSWRNWRRLAARPWRWTWRTRRRAAAIARALAAERPQTRYRVTASAVLFMAMRRLMSDHQWDGFLRSNFPQPGVA